MENAFLSLLFISFTVMTLTASENTFLSASALLRDVSQLKSGLIGMPQIIQLVNPFGFIASVLRTEIARPLKGEMRYPRICVAGKNGKSALRFHFTPRLMDDYSIQDKIETIKNSQKSKTFSIMVPGDERA